MKTLDQVQLTQIAAGNNILQNIGYISTSGLTGTLVGSSIGLYVALLNPLRGDYAPIGNVIKSLIGITTGGAIGMLGGLGIGTLFVGANTVRDYL